MDLSVVIPFCNEAENIVPVMDELRGVLEKSGFKYEVLAVNDGSFDKTQTALEAYSKNWNELIVIELRKNFGQAAALAAGFDEAQGKIIVTLDGDFQNDPCYIPAFVEKIRGGCDVVSGWRQHRQGSWMTKKLPSKVANFIISKIVGVDLHDTGCMLKAYRGTILKDVHLYGELHRFLPALCSWVGASVCEFPIEDRPRKHGQSKYGLGRTFKVLFDLFTIKFLIAYGTRPLHVFGSIGLGLLVPGTALGAWLSYERLVLSLPLASRPALLLSVLLVILGTQLFLMGLLAELIARSYHESTGRRIYSIRSRVQQAEKITV